MQRAVVNVATLYLRCGLIARAAQRTGELAEQPGDDPELRAMLDAAARSGADAGDYLRLARRFLPRVELLGGTATDNADPLVAFRVLEAGLARFPATPRCWCCRRTSRACCRRRSWPSAASRRPRRSSRRRPARSTAIKRRRSRRSCSSSTSCACACASIPSASRRRSARRICCASARRRRGAVSRRPTSRSVTPTSTSRSRAAT